VAPPAALSEPFCLTAAGMISWREFLQHAGRVAGAISEYNAICNLVAGRYEFAVLTVAALLNGQTTVLPPARAERAVRAALKGSGRPLLVESLEDLRAASASPEAPEALLARLPKAKGEIIVFTSGSTGEPDRHLKTWTSLSGGAWLTDRLIARAGLGRRSGVVVGTTPSQHMYGLEAALFSGLAFGHCLCDLPVFHPGDLDVLIERVRAEGLDHVTLVTSPPHLRFLEETAIGHPEIRCLISATAPLHADISRRIEAQSDCRVFEIYGSTETGSMAWRRSAESEIWRNIPAFTLGHGAGGWTAEAPHLPGPVVIADDVELTDDGGFRLLGRRGDMVSVAGKRHSLGALNAALLAMPGLRDGVYLRESDGGEDRLTILLVAEPRSAGERDDLIAAVRRHMMSYVDPVFVPRRIRIVDALPRGEAGKISARDLADLARTGT
jgi:acyl-coenzyme A synthetase/AMP-(fatty) acid ligase